MNKEEFNKLEIVEQVEYINRELSKGKSIRGISEEIGIAKSTIRDRFKRIGYIYNKELNIYKLEEVNNIVEKEEALEEPQNVIAEEKEEIDINTLFSLYQGLERRIEALECIREREDINIIQFNENAINRTYRIYESVQAEFKEFCRRNSKYTVTDIISTALAEYMERNRGN